ncbi:MAG: RNA-binding S4 domain-containing protein [Bacillota bacterium]|jgi:ribosomal 50S subunit-recycling heat shock protein
MRLDKFLKVSRIIKRRPVAKEVCDAGRISLNGRIAKAGSEVQVGDIINVSYGNRRLEAEILLLAETMRASEADTMYRVISDVRVQKEPLI